MGSAGDLRDYPSVLDFLTSRINYERTSSVPYLEAEFKLDRMRRLLSLLGDPHLAFPAVHIAGTKGKGSTAVMVAAILRAAGHRTALYTSPHLEAVEERIAIEGPCSQAEFVRLAAELEAPVAQVDREFESAGGNGPTYFEITTAMAFLHFARQRVDAAVLEVGLGGRLDSTNVCRSKVCIITSISFDHMRQLGNTLAAIAGEKAGIIKPRVPVISGVLAEEPRRVIQAIAAANEAPLYQRGRDFSFDYFSDHSFDRMHYREPAEWPKLSLPELKLGLLGEHQAANAAVAVAATLRLAEQGWKIDDSAIRTGLAQAHCPARIEIVRDRPAVVLDVAHNAASIEALLTVLNQRYPSGRRILIFASSRDKDTASMLRLLTPEFDYLLLTKYTINPRGLEIEQLQELTQQALHRPTSAEAGTIRQGRIETAPTSAEAWRRAMAIAGPDDLICITGSFFLAAELRPLASVATLERTRT